MSLGSRTRLAAALAGDGDTVMVSAADLSETLLDIGRLADACRTTERFLDGFAQTDADNFDVFAMVYQHLLDQMERAGVKVAATGDQPHRSNDNEALKA